MHLLDAVRKTRAHKVRTACSNTLEVLEITILTSNPVNSNAFHPADACSNDVFSPCLVTFGTGYSVQAHICPVHSVISCRIHHTVNDRRKLGWLMRLPQKYLCPQTKQLMKPHFTAARPISPNVVWDYKVWWHKYPHSSATALCWHIVPEQERQLSAKFYRAVYCFMQNMVLIKLLWTCSDYTALLQKHMK